MPSRTIKQKYDLDQLVSLLYELKRPFTVQWQKGKLRSVEQNRLQRLWMREASEQLQDETPEEKRGYCKLHFGCAILYHENPTFAEAFDKVIRPLPYEAKLQAMMIPLDMPVTRIMTSGQKKRYLDDIWHHFTSKGVKLTDPEHLENVA